MRFHVTGVGSIGSLIAFHLRRTLRASQVHFSQYRDPQTTPSNLSIEASQQNAGIDPSTRLDVSSASGDGASEDSAQPSANGRKSLDGVQRQRASGGPPHFFNPAPHAARYMPLQEQSSVTLHLRGIRNRRGHIGTQSMEDSILYERENVKWKEQGFRLEEHHAKGLVFDGLLGGNSSGPGVGAKGGSTRSQGAQAPGICAAAGLGRDAIDSLIVSSKADTTLDAIKSLSKRLTPASTVVLLQNGQGVLDLLNTRLFPDPETRPNFIIASTTHGAYRQNRLHVVHAAFGTLNFAIVPNPARAPRGYEHLLVQSPKDAGAADQQREAANRSAGNLRTQNDGVSSRRPRGWEIFRPAAAAETSQSASSSALVYRDRKLLDVGAIPSDPHSTLTLQRTVATLLSLPLNVTWQPIREMQLTVLKKLVVNACINPLTALAECRNGDLFGNGPATDTMRSICAEASTVLIAQARAAAARDRLDDPEGAEERLAQAEEVFKLSGLLSEALDVARLTSQNISSMLQDIQSNRGSTEVEFINGYIAALGESMRIPTPVNLNLARLVTLKATRAGRGPIRRGVF
ncbi:panE, apbA [Ceraceosorus bombacis]|uniref:PanE, apbA n=1 Tax=Ceraceosorus bombacis TaxID=401625 RepID=A0A0N7LA63_9BASI|nr:panE, apbA [Ceraceosorus bombacis]